MTQKKVVSVTIDGITVKVNPDVMDDIDLLADMGELQGGDVFVIPRVLEKVYGQNYSKIKEKLANADGVTTVSSLVDFLEKTMTALAAVDDSAKN